MATSGAHANRAGRAKRVLTIAALVAGGVATVAWIVFLGWAATVTLKLDAYRTKTHLPAKHAATTTPPKPTKGYKGPSQPTEKPTTHP